ncbi:MAG TPA: lysophospholipid acyltransferase family protein [Syntrophales bacterium]|nr:lysophospholipid acyltransferase family protein [Syntrophales bacterium]
MVNVLKRLADFAITAILWTYYIGGFILVFSPLYFVSFFFRDKRDVAYQQLNNLFFRSFFALLRTVVPRVTWQVSDEVRAIRSSVIIANHLSFLDPILFVSLFARQKTVVKKDYFRVPVFGWILETSGYIPAFTEDSGAEILLEQVGKMKTYLAEGGNLFMFPEGTRSRDGRIGAFDRGAFRIAKFCDAPIRVVVIRNTGRLYPPGRFLFNTRERFTISVESAGTLTPDYADETFSLSALMAKARTRMEGRDNP